MKRESNRFKDNPTVFFFFFFDGGFIYAHCIFALYDSQLRNISLCVWKIIRHAN